MIENVVFKLADKFPEIEWDLEILNNVNVVLCNDYNFYFYNKSLKNLVKVLRIKNKGLKFILAYKKFNHE